MRLLFAIILLAGACAVATALSVKLFVPTTVRRGDTAQLHCMYDLEGETLYSVKWYLESDEFCRYVPRQEYAPLIAFPIYGFEVLLAASNGTHMTLSDVQPAASGNYKCEVSTDAPTLYTEADTKGLLVVDYEHVTRVPIETKNSVSTEGDTKLTPLHMAALNGHVNVIRVLIEKGANVDANDKDKQTPLHVAASNGHANVTRVLIENGADMNAKDKYEETPLQKTFSKGHVNVIRVLIEKGANMDAKDKDGMTLLHVAALKGDENLTRVLIEMGADLNTGHFGQTTRQQPADTMNSTELP